MFTQMMVRLGSLVVSLVLLCACTGGPTLDTTSSAAYKQTLQKILDAQKDEPKRLEIVKSMVAVVTEGKEGSAESSTQGYDLYDKLAVFGGAGRLMPLNGKTADEILTMGHEVRKKWVLANIPKEIDSIQQKIASLTEKKKQVEQIKETEKNFQVENVTLALKEALEYQTDKPLGGVNSFVISGNGVNNGSMPVYGCTLDITIKDIKKNILYNDNTSIRFEFKTPVEPNSNQSFTKELSVMSWQTTPYEIDRYSLQYTLKNVNASRENGLYFGGGAQFTSLDERELSQLEKKLQDSTNLLNQFKK